MFKPTRILVPTDMSDYSFRAIRLGFDIAKEYNAKVFLLHVMQSPVQECVFDYCPTDDLVESLKLEMLESARKGILQQLSRLPWIDVDTIATHVRTGVPYEEILNLAEELEIHLIVIGSLGATGLAKYLMGGVARQVLLGANCSVLLSK
ncbi:MAG: universal stress protein [Geobacteraceae bacterium]